MCKNYFMAIYVKRKKGIETLMAHLAPSYIVKCVIIVWRCAVFKSSRAIDGSLATRVSGCSYTPAADSDANTTRVPLPPA